MPVVQIDGRWVLAYCGPRPLWRDVEAATVGGDRDEVVAFLVATGYLHPTGDTATKAEVTKAIRALCRPPVAWDHFDVSSATVMGPPVRQ